MAYQRDFDFVIETGKDGKPSEFNHVIIFWIEAQNCKGISMILLTEE
jgi:hypothetical protein